MLQLGSSKAGLDYRSDCSKLSLYIVSAEGKKGNKSELVVIRG